MLGLQKGLADYVSPSLSNRLGTEISVQGAAWRGAAQGARDHQAGLRRVGGDDRQWRAVARPRPYVRRNPAAHLRQRLRQTGKGPVLAQDPAGVRAYPQTLLGDRKSTRLNSSP